MEKQATRQPLEDNIFKDDEIDLFELWNGLVEEKLTIFLSFLIVVSLGAIYAFSVSPVYESKASMLPPFENDVRSVDFGKLVHFSSDELYSKFLINLKSSDILYSLLDQPEIQEFMPSDVSKDVLVKSIQKEINVGLPKKDKEELLVSIALVSSMTVKANDPEAAFALLTGLVSLASDLTKQEVVNEKIGMLKERKVELKREFESENKRINEEKNAKIARLLEADLKKKNEIKQQIMLLKQKYQENKSYKIARLESDYELAKKLGIRTPTIPQDYKKENKSRVTALLEVRSNQNLSRYWLGTEILKNKIQVLKNQKNDEAFIEGLAELQTQLGALSVNHEVEMLKARKSNIPFSQKLRDIQQQMNLITLTADKLNSTQFAVYRFLQKPVIPSEPVKPKKALILAVSGVLGLMLGIFIALIRRAIKNRKASLAAS